MAESNNERWTRHLAPFDVAPISVTSRPAAPQEEVDRSWLPMPSVGASGIDWWRDRGAEKAWRQPRDWAAKHEPAFFARLEAAEQTLLGLERTAKTYDPRMADARYQVSRYYTQLNKLFDGWTRKQPLVRY